MLLVTAVMLKTVTKDSEGRFPLETKEDRSFLDLFYHHYRNVASSIIFLVRKVITKNSAYLQI